MAQRRSLSEYAFVHNLNAAFVTASLGAGFVRWRFTRAGQSELHGSLSTRDSKNRRTLKTYTSAKSTTGLRVSISTMAASISHSIAHNIARVIIGARCTPAAQ